MWSPSLNDLFATKTGAHSLSAILIMLGSCSICVYCPNHHATQMQFHEKPLPRKGKTDWGNTRNTQKKGPKMCCGVREMKSLCSKTSRPSPLFDAVSPPQCAPPSSPPEKSRPLFVDAGWCE
ncbi:hypothetical protein LX32DRAFT_33878 [Colletotrichum zoysiae]|uniref:Uncharacterized protein n=1 Tax=Colletotrichum zoysiae TaxID=1216348 RepID=A0AAD9HC47_9PEZI|nr:hypothetical protein LX32DRAFT_33878 [Colletotrichum zoysiae]